MKSPSMSLTLKSDPSRPGGGYAILRVDGGAPSSVAIEDRSSGLYLAPGGKWTKQPNYFDIEPIDATDARLGPEIVDHVEADTILALHSAGAGVLGILVWPAIRPSAGASSGNVIDEPAASNAAGITGEIPPAAEGASAATEEAVTAALAEPLPPPPPPMSVTRPGLAAPPPAAKGLSLRNALVIANGLAVLIIGLFLFRGTETAKGLVCEPTGALRGVSLARTFVSCPETAEVDPEQTAYNDYLQCLPGKAACAQTNCGDAYLSGFTNGSHSAQVNAARTESQKSCQADAQKKTMADDFSAFSECMRITINVCNRAQCVDRYRYKLTVEPYASSLHQEAETAANDCRRLQEESAFADFNRCVAGAAACDTARCAGAFTAAFPASSYVSKVLSTAENAARICAATQRNTGGVADCDRLAAARFDADRPANSGFVDDVATLSDEDLEKGLRACEGADVDVNLGRRIYLQRGRLLAERAVRLAKNGSSAQADQDMGDAVKNWRTADEQGSVYSANLLGTFYIGSFNRAGAHEFVTPDEYQANRYWFKAAQGGNVIGERNYAAQLLVGNGVRQDVERAVTLLRDALRRGDERAAGTLGVALYTGYPAAIGQDKIEGWRLAKRGACVDKSAREMIEREINKGRQPPSERPTCY